MIGLIKEYGFLWYLGATLAIFDITPINWRFWVIVLPFTLLLSWKMTNYISKK